MCQKCEWRALVTVAKGVLGQKPRELPDPQRDWITAIMVTVDDDHHCTDHQKSVIRRILREHGVGDWRAVPKAMDKSEWSTKRRKAWSERRKLAARCRQHGGF